MGMPDDNDIHTHRLEGQSGVQQRLALFHAAAKGGHIDYVSAEHLARLLEGNAGAGAGLVKQRNNDATPQSGDFLYVPPEDFSHGLGAVQHRMNFRG